MIVAMEMAGCSGCHGASIVVGADARTDPGEIYEGCVLNPSDASARIIGEGRGDSMAVPGDVNRDGYDDLLVTVFEDVDSSGTYLFLGPLRGDITTEDAHAFVLHDRMMAVGRIGDLSGDGMDDVAISAPICESGSGTVSIFFSPFTGGHDLADADRYFVGERWGHLGEVIIGGDVNGDLRDDLIMSAPELHEGDRFYSEAGAVYAFHAPVMPGALITSWDYRFFIESAADHRGLAMAAGDINGDGIDDLAVGSDQIDRLPDTHADYLDGVYVSYGPLEGEQDEHGPDAFLLGPGVSDFLAYFHGGGAGRALVVDDFVSGGHMELAIGAPYGMPPPDARRSEVPGIVYIVSGEPRGVNELEEIAYARFVGSEPEDLAGLSLSSGDVDGDGYIDLVVGGSGYNHHDSGMVGRVYIIRGAIQPGEQELDDADIVLVGLGPGDLFGRQVSTGDFNSDGFADVAVLVSNPPGNVVALVYDGGSC